MSVVDLESSRESTSNCSLHISIGAVCLYIVSAYVCPNYWYIICELAL